MPQVRRLTSNITKPSVLYPRINLWTPKAPMRIPQTPADTFLLASPDELSLIFVNLPWVNISVDFFRSASIIPDRLNQSTQRYKNLHRAATQDK